jgi:hypothetical protein
MIAPSPDWFAGAANVELIENGRWVTHKRVILYAWDAGTDSGTTYQAADDDTVPRDRVRMNKSPHFQRDERPVPVGTLLFQATE